MKSANWRIWDDHSAYGELLYRRAIGELEEMESAKSLCDIVKPLYRPGMSVADVGCGAGHYLRSLRSRVDSSINYTGIDATAGYIAFAKKAFPDGASFRVGDIFNIPAADGEFELVMNNNVLLHLPPPLTKPISELLRISRRHVVIRTVFGHQNYVIKELGPKEGDDLNELDMVLSEDELRSFSYFNMYTERYFRQVIAQADPSAKVEITPDTRGRTVENRTLTGATGTTVQNGQQVSGNLLLDWRFIVITKG